MKIVKADASGLRLAVDYLKRGKAVVYPTDTSYGLGVDATNLTAVKRLYLIKQRKYNQPVHVIVSSFAQAKEIAIFNPTAEKLFKKFLPGPLTIVLHLTLSLSCPCGTSSPEMGEENMEGIFCLSHRGRGGERGAWRILSGGSGPVGVRRRTNEIALK